MLTSTKTCSGAARAGVGEASWSAVADLVAMGFWELTGADEVVEIPVGRRYLVAALDRETVSVGTALMKEEAELEELP